MTDAKLSTVPEFDDRIPGDVFELVYDDSGLLVRVTDAKHGLAIRFEIVVGFRLLDEGNLLEFWSSEENGSGGWVYSVESGGWLDQETARAGFLSDTTSGLREYLVATQNACVSVLCREPPKRIDGPV